MALLRTRGIEKRYGDNVAVRDATVEFLAGEIHAVVGENGAGKSTLLGIAAGQIAPDAGVVEIDGKPLSRRDAAAEAIARGVGMVAQHFQLIEALTALENVILGVEPTRAGVLDERSARARLEKVAREIELEVRPDARVAELDVGARQRLEIARVLFRDARIVILDEPTAVLTPQESDALYTRLRVLADAGRAVVVVTHKLDEVMAHADVATVLRRGAVVATRRIERGDTAMRETLTKDVMGQAEIGATPAIAAARDEVVLRVWDASAPRLGPISFAVRAGEIVGLAGIEGNGQRELFAALAGLTPLDHGTIDAPSGRSVLHGDRHEEGLVLDATLEDNVVLGELSRFARLGWIDRAALAREAERRLEASGATPRARTATARSLSGGNQQKVAFARALARTVAGGGAAKVLCVAHPTRGVDVGAQAAIHERLAFAAAQGCGVLVASSDLDELRGLSHRLLVISGGRIVAELEKTADNEVIGRAMLGAARAETPSEARP